MSAKEFFEKHINKEDCNWSEFQQCNNHKFTITYMMEQYAKQEIDRKLIELRTSLLCQSVLYDEAQIKIFNHELKRLFCFGSENTAD